MENSIRNPRDMLMEMQPNFFFDVFEPNHYQNGADVLNQEQIPYNSRYGLGD